MNDHDENTAAFPYNERNSPTRRNPMQERLTEIEIKLAHVEQALQELSDVLYRQQGLLDRLEQRYNDLRQRVETNVGAGAEAGAADEKPPHY